MYRCSKKFRFEAAHALTQLPPDHKCHNTHGHGYEITITLESSLLRLGMIVDFGDISEFWVFHLKPLLDHRNLNEVPELEGISLTTECLAKWIFDKCYAAWWGVSLYSVRVQETPTCWAEYIRDERST